MIWLHGVLAVLCLVIGVLHLLRLALIRREVVVEASYAAMGLGMAGMFSPVGNPVPDPVWVAVFLACAAWFGALMLRRRSLRALGGEAAHFAIGSGAMLFMLGQGEHGSGGGTGHVAGAASAIALVLAAYFVLHTLRCVDRLHAVRYASSDCAPQQAATAEAVGTGTIVLAAPAPTSMLCSPRIPALAHVVITVGMAVMLVAMI